MTTETVNVSTMGGEQSNGTTQTITQQCLNCKGTGKKFSLAKCIYKLTFMLIFLLVALSGETGAPAYGVGMAVVVMIGGFGKRCKVCKGKGSTTQSITFHQ